MSEKTDGAGGEFFRKSADLRREIIKAHRLTPLARLVALYMLDLANLKIFMESKGYELISWPAVATIAEDLGVTSRAVQLARASLVNIGLISTYDGAGGRQRTTHYCFSIDWMATAEAAKPDEKGEGDFTQGVNVGSRKGEGDFAKGRTLVHPSNIEERIEESSTQSRGVRPSQTPHPPRWAAAELKLFDEIAQGYEEAQQPRPTPSRKDRATIQRLMALGMDHEVVAWVTAQVLKREMQKGRKAPGLTYVAEALADHARDRTTPRAPAEPQQIDLEELIAASVSGEKPSPQNSGAAPRCVSADVVRERLKAEGIKIGELAKALGVAGPTMSNRLSPRHAERPTKFSLNATAEAALSAWEAGRPLPGMGSVR